MEEAESRERVGHEVSSIAQEGIRAIYSYPWEGGGGGPILHTHLSPDTNGTVKHTVLLYKTQPAEIIT